MGQNEECERLLNEAERICREQGLEDWLQTILGNRAGLLCERGHLDEAIRLNREKELICRKLGLQRGLTFALHHQGEILLSLGRTHDALQYHREEESICKAMGFKEGLQASLQAQANVFYAQGELQSALTSLHECEVICRELGADGELADALRFKGEILHKLEHLDDAVDAFAEAEKLCRNTRNLNGLQLCLGSLALLQRARGDISAAIRLHKEEVEICRQSQLPYALQSAIGNLALAFQENGDLEDAIRSLEEQESICRMHGFMDGVVRCLANRGRLHLYATRQPVKAQMAAAEALQIARDHGLTSLISPVTQLMEVIDRTLREAGRQLHKRAPIAKILFMESAAVDSPVRPFNPLNLTVTAQKSDCLLDEILRLHWEDCDRSGFGIPLLLGVPEAWIKEIKSYFMSDGYQGLDSELVSICPEPDVPLFSSSGQMLMDGLYKLATHLQGGGACLVHLIESGKLSELWKSGIRWLMLGQISNLRANVDTGFFRILNDYNGPGLFEIVERPIFPNSKLIVLEIEGRPICVDDRKLRCDDLEQLRDSPFVGTGTFWVRCDKLAEVFGINQEMLETEWDQEAWRGRLSGEVFQENSIPCSSGGFFGMVVPLWEVLSKLPLGAIKVGADRVDVVEIPTEV